MLISIQSFSVADQSGGSRILRALLESPEIPALSICTTAKKPALTPVIEELIVPLRPSMGRLERTRYAWLPLYLDSPNFKRLQRKLTQICRERGATCIHTVAHGSTFGLAVRVASELKLPLLGSFHDDVGYMMRGHPAMDRLLADNARLWQEATYRFVISDELGQEFSRRYGDRPFERVTDGLTTVHPSRAGRRPPVIYFMGLLHNTYLPNFLAICAALAKLNETAEEKWKFVIRTGLDSLPFSTPEGLVEMRPFGSEADVERDLESASVVYMPLPFGPEHRDFVQYSLSTKMVTYLGGGIPILYHGPADAAAGALLARHDAAICVDSLAERELQAALAAVRGQGALVVERASELARNEFMLSDQRATFWNAVRTA